MNLRELYALGRSGWQDTFDPEGRVASARSAWSLWMSDRAISHGRGLECGCTRYFGRVRLIRYPCPTHWGLK